MMRRVGNLAVLLLALSCSLWLRTASAGLQCPTTFLPSDVLPSVKYNYSADPFADFFARLHKTVPATVAQGQYQAYSIALVHRDQIVYSSGLVNTPFRLASITKSFTCLGALLLRERGRLSLDDPVKKFLPSFSVINPYGKHDITLRELMGHVSGLPRDFGCLVSPCITSEEKALELIARMQLIRPPWSNIPVYSNIGVALLGHAWEKATSPQKSWSDFLRDEFLNPLGMNNTGTDLAHVNLAAGDLSPYPANASTGWNGPAGEMYSTAIDMAKYLKFLLKPDTRFLSQASVSEWIHVNTLFPDNKGAGFALPWELLPVATSSNATSILITKSGGIGTYETFIGFQPDTEVGIAVLVSYGPNTTESPITIATSILTDFIPVVEAANFAIISPSYTGVYICEHTAPIVSPDLNETVEVLHGRIEVTGSASQGLRAFVNVTSKVGGNATSQVFHAFMLLKNGTENGFWVNPTYTSGTWNDCEYLALSVGSDPDIWKPNVPGSAFYYEAQFAPQSKLLRWPSWGAVCHNNAREEPAFSVKLA